MSLDRAWYVDANVAYPDNSTAALVAKSYLFLVKNLLIGSSTGTNGTSGAPPAGSKWTVDGSSDSATAGIDQTDRWTTTFDATKIVRANGAVAHSWIVLKSPAAIGPMYLCLDYSSATDGTFVAVCSKTAFTGGSITARPTATEEFGFSALVLADTTAAGTHRMTRVTDASGNFFVYTARAGAGLFNSFCAVQTLLETVTGDVRPVVFIYSNLSSGRGAPQSSDLTNLSTTTGGIHCRSYNGSEAASGGSSVSGIFNHAAFVSSTLANAANSKYDTFKAYYRYASTTYQGIKGWIPDCHLISAAKPVGDVEPASGNSEHVCAGVLLVPNGGVVPSI